jgi:hypothetical protein
MERMNVDSIIVQFYLGKTSDNRERTIEQIWQWDYDVLERTHDYIPWLFPLPEVSRFHPHAPILTSADIDRFKNSFGLKTRLTVSLNTLVAISSRFPLAPTFPCVNSVGYTGVITTISALPEFSGA